MYSLGMTEDLNAFWKQQEELKQARLKLGKVDDSFRRLDQYEKSFEIYKPPKSETSASKGGSKVFDEPEVQDLDDTRTD